MTTPFIQTKIAQYFVRSLNKDFKTDIAIDEVAVSIFGGVKFKKVLILDHHKDTLIYANRIKTTILEGKKLLDGDLVFGDLRLDGLFFNLKTYKNEKFSNIDKFIAAFETGKKSKKHFLLKSSKLHVYNGHFILTDENRATPVSVNFTKLNASVDDFQLYGSEVTTIINKMSFLDHRGLYVENLSSKFSYSKKSIKLEDLDLLTRGSKVKGTVYLNYKIEDFSNFTDKVQFNIKLDTASIASNDIRFFYKELGKNQHFFTKANIKGTLNDLRITNLNLIDSKNTQIIGDVNFKNLFANKEHGFYMYGKFDKLYSSYDKLIVILPDILGKKLPTTLKKLGKFSAKGITHITTTTIDADFSSVI